MYQNQVRKNVPSMLSQPLLGLDIASDAVRFVELSASRKQLTVVQADSEPLGRGVGGDAAQGDFSPITEAIRRMLQRSRVRTRAVASALPGSSVIVKIISMPSGMRDEVIEEQIRYEGQQYIPFPMDQVNFDFSVLGTDPERKGYQQILLVASKRDHVEDRAAILEGAGLKPKIIDIRQFSLWGLYTHLYPGDATSKSSIVLVEIGGLSSGLHVFERGQPVYSRDHNFGAARLIDRIVQHFGLTEEDAQRMQRFGGLPAGYEQEVLKPFVLETGREILRALDFFQASMPDIHVDKVVLFGTGANLPGICEQLAGFTVENPDPFQGMAIGPNVNERFLRDERSSMAVACGLALRRFGE